MKKKKNMKDRERVKGKNNKNNISKRSDINSSYSNSSIEELKKKSDDRLKNISRKSSKNNEEEIQRGRDYTSDVPSEKASENIIGGVENTKNIKLSGKMRREVSDIDEEELKRIEDLDKIKSKYSNINFKSVINLSNEPKYSRGTSRDYIKEEESKKVYKREILLVAILIFLTIVLVVGILTWQTGLVSNTDIKEIETLRDSEIRSEINNTREKNKELEAKINEVEENIEKYMNNEEKGTENVINEEIKEAEMNLGYTNLVGEGLEITLSDNSKMAIDSNDILYLVNKLWASGAEAISVNGERIVSTSEITTVNVDQIYINTHRVDSPYVIRVIGNTKDLEGELTSKNGLLNELKGNGKTVEYKALDSIRVPKYKGEIRIKYGK